MLDRGIGRRSATGKATKQAGFSAVSKEKESKFRKLLIGMSSLSRHPEIHFFPVEAPPQWWGTLSCQYTSYNNHYGPPKSPAHCSNPPVSGLLTDSTLPPCAHPSVPSLLQSQSRGLPANMGSSIIDIQRDSTWPSVDCSL